MACESRLIDNRSEFLSENVTLRSPHGPPDGTLRPLARVKTMSQLICSLSPAHVAPCVPRVSIYTLHSNKVATLEEALTQPAARRALWHVKSQRWPLRLLRRHDKVRYLAPRLTSRWRLLIQGPISLHSGRTKAFQRVRLPWEPCLGRGHG